MQTHHDLPVSGVSAGEIASEGYDLDALLNQHFAGRVVRKDLTKQLKEGANVPVYVLEYLLGMSNSRKREYHNISEQLGLCDGAIEELIRCKESSGSEEDPKMYAQQDTAILNDFLTSMEFEIVMEKIKQSLFSYYLYALSSDEFAAKRREQNAKKLEEARLLMNKYGYFPVENDVISQVHMENAIGVLNAYLRKLPKRLCDEFRKK